MVRKKLGFFIDHHVLRSTEYFILVRRANNVALSVNSRLASSLLRIDLCAYRSLPSSHSSCINTGLSCIDTTPSLFARVTGRIRITRITR